MKYLPQANIFRNATTTSLIRIWRLLYPNMNTQLAIIITFFISTQAFGQYLASERIDESQLEPWTPKTTFEFQGVYHFGDSEGESDLILFFGGHKFYGQLRSGAFSEDGTKWMWRYENINNIRIEGNTFVSDKIHGEFVFYGNESRSKGLKINNPWSAGLEPGTYEVGLRHSRLEAYFPGKFPKASMWLLSKEDLQALNKNDLKIMRNEIFARYGLIFQAGREMDRYFRKQKWYRGLHQDVDNFLTELERTNIKLIIEVERD